ncbi:MAG: DUF4249 domain-containing protein [Cyclobacteriaceae bacterium]|nr:DUF4249 domain-containing protein [Cyclobacteriaceae bacterium]MDW8331877.1 DUF4249 domain-containing protein [Cyclobacteriaceae bacterium]
MMNKILVVVAPLFGLVSTSCESVIYPDLPEAEAQLVIDAWVNNKEEPQWIRLSKTQPYFENTLPPPVSGALIRIEGSDGSEYIFSESDTLAGAYVWVPGAGERLGMNGVIYTLTVEAEGEIYTAVTRMGRVPVIDSITFRVERGNQFVDDLYLAEFWAVDPVGFGDTYWIRAYKNGVLLNKPSEIILAYDAGFSRGGRLDGVPFIAPIRRGVNPFEQDERGRFLSPYVPGDSVYVELHSLSEASFDFLTLVSLQTNRPGGFSELFATPLSNVTTNLVNINPNGKKALGFFNVAAVSGSGRKFNSLDDISNP